MRLITGTMNAINEVVRCKRFTREKLITSVMETSRKLHQKHRAFTFYRLRLQRTPVQHNNLLA